MGNGGGSPYMQDLIEKLNFAKTELLGKMSMGEAMREWSVHFPSPGVMQKRADLF